MYKLCFLPPLLLKEKIMSLSLAADTLPLPYFDGVCMTIIDPMHNLYLGTAKYIFCQIWVKRGLIGSLDIINERIQSLRIPSEVRFNRLPACMEYPSSLTAEMDVVGKLLLFILLV